jgi:hypothetical protein
MLKRRDFVQGAGLVIASSLSPLAIRAANAANATPSDLLYPDQSKLAPPPKDFSSNHNYFIYGGGKPIIGLVVTIEVTEDMVAPTGMSMQLNCSPPKDADCAWQQYVTGFSPNNPTLAIGASIENFPSKSFRWQLHQTIGFNCGGAKNPTEATCKGDIISEHFGKFATFSAPKDTVPAGYKIKYELLSDANDVSGAITGVDYSVTDNHGQTKTTGQKLLKTFKFDHTKNKPVGPHAVAPILAVQMNLVGVSGGRFMVVKSGAGTITYEAKTPLTAEGTPPATINNTSTAETASIAYAELGVGSATQIVQKFQAVAPPPGATAKKKAN